ncbi:hypothetical protein ACFL1P_01350 [Patescibacteria group bacterium]
MSIQTIYILGNTIEPSDSLPLQLLPKLITQFPNIKFIHYDPTDEFQPHSSNIILIDTIVGIEHVTIFSDLTKFKQTPRNSVHDFDLMTSLELLKKLQKIRSVQIIGIPQSGNKTIIWDDLKSTVKKILSTI